MSRDFIGSDLEKRIDRLWCCCRCGYFAFSSPDFSITFFGDEIGGGSHKCPECGDSYWHWCGGDNREKRMGYAALLAGDTLAGEDG